MIGDLVVWIAVGTAGVAVIWQRQARVLLGLSAALLTAAVLRLAWLFATENWAYEVVIDNTRSGLALPIRVAGMWAGPEGSLLLWTAMVSWAALIASTRQSGRSTSVIGCLLVVGYGSFLALTSSPFDRVTTPPANGLGLQPVLEHPAMVWHPPILYLGLVSLLVPSLISLGKDRSPDQRRWRLPLALLTVGLATGARWAHAELGWGGFWAWDPIESAGLVAWLCAVTALHSPVGWRIVRVLPAIAVLWATTLTRIGLISSVHAFADRPALRVGLIAVAALSTVLFIGAVGRDWTPAPLSGPTAGAAMLGLTAFFVAVGTYEPLIEAATSGDRSAIAGTYYTRLLWPVVMIAIGVVLLVTRPALTRSIWRDRRPEVLGIVWGLVITPSGAGPFGLALAAGAGALIGSSLARWKSPGALAHLGVGVLLLGVAGSIATSVEIITVGAEPATLDSGISLTHRGLEIEERNDQIIATAEVEVDGQVMRPELVRFLLRGVSTTEIAHRFDGLDEIQVILIDGSGTSGEPGTSEGVTGLATYRVNRLPRVALIWLGSLLTALGFADYFLSRRFRSSSRLTVEELSSDEVESASG